MENFERSLFMIIYLNINDKVVAFTSPGSSDNQQSHFLLLVFR